MDSKNRTELWNIAFGPNVVVMFTRQPGGWLDPNDCNHRKRQWMELGKPMMIAPRVAVLPTRAEPGEPGWMANIYLGDQPPVERLMIFGSLQPLSSK